MSDPDRDGPNMISAEGARSAGYFALSTAAFGAAIAAYGWAVTGEEYQIIAGTAVAFLGAGSRMLMKFLFK